MKNLAMMESLAIAELLIQMENLELKIELVVKMKDYCPDKLSCSLAILQDQSFHSRLANQASPPFLNCQAIQTCRSIQTCRAFQRDRTLLRNHYRKILRLVLMSSVFNPTHLDPSLVSLDLLSFSPLSSYLSSSNAFSFYFLIHHQSHWMMMMSHLKSQMTSFSFSSLASSKVHPPAALQVDRLVLAASKGAETSKEGSHQESSIVAITNQLETAGTVIEVNHSLARNLEI